MMAGGWTRLIFGVGGLQVMLLEMKGEGSGGSAGGQGSGDPDLRSQKDGVPWTLLRKLMYSAFF